MVKWMEESWSFQQSVHKEFGYREWDSLNRNEENLKRKLVEPFEYCFGQRYNDDEKLMEKADHVEAALLKLFKEENYCENFDITYINLMEKDDKDSKTGIYCVFWLQNASRSLRCVDLHGRNYKSWTEFINDNRLSTCYMMYPKGGRYCLNFKHVEDFVDVVFEESVACSTGRTVKTVFDVIATAGGLIATGVLAFNPVSGPVILGATAVATAAGVYCAGNSIGQLVDIHQHEGGLSLKESKTLLTTGELVLNVGSTAAVAVSAGLKGVAKTTGKVLSGGSVALTVANNYFKVARVVFFMNVGCDLARAVDNYLKNGNFIKEDILRLCKKLFHGFNVSAPKELVEKAVCYLAEQIKEYGRSIIEFFVSSIHRVGTAVRKFWEFSAHDLNDLIKIILPDFVIDKYRNVMPHVKQSLTIVDNIVKGEFDIKNLKALQKELNFLWNECFKYRAINTGNLEKVCDQKTCTAIKLWTKIDGIDLFYDSDFDAEPNIDLAKMRAEVATFAMKDYCTNMWRIEEKLTNIMPLVKRSVNIVARTVIVEQKGEFDIQYCHSLREEFKRLWIECCKYRVSIERELKRRFDVEICNSIKQWTKNDGIDLFHSSKFDEKVNSVVKIEQDVKETIKRCIKDDEESDFFKDKKSRLLSHLFCLVKRDGVKDASYVINKIKYFCKAFEPLYNNINESCHYKYFLHTSTKDKNGKKESFFRSFYKTDNIYEYVFSRSLDELVKEEKNLHQEFEKNFEKIQTNERKERILYEFTMPGCNSWLSEEQFYLKAEEFLPNFESKFSKNSTTFDEYKDSSLAIIKCKQNEFIVFFYVVIEDDSVKCLMLYDENLDV